MQQHLSVVDFIKSSKLSTVIDEGLCHIYRTQPTSPRDVFNEFLSVVKNSQQEFYRSVQNQFEVTLTFVEAHGYISPEGCQAAHPEVSIAEVSPSSLHFAVPLANGGVFELFPGGSGVSVTKLCLPNFLGLLGNIRRACLKLRQNAVNGTTVPVPEQLSGSEPTRITDLSCEEILTTYPVTKLAEYLIPPQIMKTLYIPSAFFYLPLAPHLHVSSDPTPRGRQKRNYGAVLELMKTFVGDKQSPWNIYNKSSINLPASFTVDNEVLHFSSYDSLWAFYGVTFSVPFNESLHTVSGYPKEKGSEEVPLSSAAGFVANAIATLNSLVALEGEGGVDEDVDTNNENQEPNIINGNSKPISPMPVVESNGTPNGSAQVQHRTAEEPMSLINILDFEVGPAERCFWENLDALRRAPPEHFPTDKMSFVLSLPGGKLKLKENGEFLTVTRNNLGLFIDAILEHKAEVHNMYSGTVDRKQARPPEGEKNNSHGCRHRPHQVLNNTGKPEAPPPVAPPTAHPTATTSTPAYVNPATPSLTVASSASQRSNSQLESSLARFPVSQSSRWNTFVLTTEDLARHAYVEQIIDLESRFHDGHVGEDRLRRERFYIPTGRGVYELVPNGKNVTVNKTNAAEYFYRVRHELAKIDCATDAWDPNARATTHGKAHLHQQRIADQLRRHTRRNPSKNLLPPSSKGAVLNCSELLFLHEFMYFVEQLSYPAPLDSVLISAKLSYSVYFPNTHARLQLRPNGCQVQVTADSFNEYFGLLEELYAEIEKEVLSKGAYVIPTSRSVEVSGGGAASEGQSGAQQSDRLFVDSEDVASQPPVTARSSPSQIPAKKPGALLFTPRHVK